MSVSIKYKEKTVSVGDRVKVVQKIVESGKERRQIFLGTVIKISGDINNKSITVRRIGNNQIGIERIYPLNLPSIEEILVTAKGGKGVKRSKLYYIRDKSKKEIEKIFSREKRRS